HEVGVKVIGLLARPGEFVPHKFYKPTSEELPGEPFQQQRGLQENRDGPTGDIRDMRERLGQDMPEPALGEGPRKVDVDSTRRATTFYNDEE
ncbi:MAG: hypothetical protein HC899_39265, partial [Leptolyngbyaceae cyanobacterium SM1_4_3]|nr:hypothetical protein [Leptolyngbyaceae cyanobacterium SM1_4_3]